VAFQASLDAGGQGIFTGSGGPTTTLYDTNGPFSSVAFPSLNDAGTVAFQASLDAGGFGIFTGSGGPTTTIATNVGPFSGFSPPSLNNAGTVAFDATLEAGGRGIFTGPDPVDDRVIGTGDPLFGSTVTGVFVGPEGLNDSGQLAFRATLADGRQVIVRADPVPEPSGVLLLGLGMLGLLGYARRARKQAA
jgi:hypothetical protein